MDKKTHQYVQEITKAAKNNNLIFFIGAGISRISNYPQWGELVDKYYINLYGEQKEDSYSSDEYLRIPQIFHDVEGPEAYDKLLEDVFSVDRDTNSIHKKILAMNPVHILTTNYDNLIEKACWERGQYLSVISSEEDVANSTSSRYLLKVHGDFSKGYKGEHVILKESDYMNYERNFPLISNLMKTLMATHTIVFIGYGLGDYNINSLLNWVRQLQKDGYTKPFFIRGDHEPVEEKTAVYYEKRGLRIIDTADLIESSKGEYLQRYEAFMNILIDSKDNDLLSTDEDAIDYIHHKLSPLFPLKYIRKLDLKYVFEYDYHFRVDGKIIGNKNKSFKYMERFFEFKEKGVDILNKSLKKKFEEIEEFFRKNGISGMLEDRNRKDVEHILNVHNPAYHSNYEEMTRLVELQPNNLEEEYRNAFYLAYLGKWEEAYNLYSGLLLKSIDESNWWIHYLSQINRYRLYQSISQTVRNLNGVGIIAHGRNNTHFSDEFLQRIEIEMKKFEISEVFGSMPYEFQEKYRILEFLSDNKFLYDDTVKLFELTNKIHSEISKGSYSFGITSSHETQLRLNDNLQFLYDNCLWSATFNEFKQYIRNSLILLLEKAEFDMTRDNDDSGFFSGLQGPSFYFDYYDFVNVAKSLTIEDVKHIERKCELNRFEFRDIEKIESYLLRITDELIKHFSRDGMNIVFYKQFIPEIKTAIYFAKYIKLSEESFAKIVRALLFYFPERDADIGTRFIWIDRLAWKNELPKKVIQVIEEFLIGQADKHSDIDFTEDSRNGFNSKNLSNLISYYDDKFVSTRLSEYALDLSKAMNSQVEFMYRLSKILSLEAKEHLRDIKKIEDIDAFMNGVEMGVIEDLSDYQNLINDFMDRRLMKIREDRKNGVKSLYGRKIEVELGIWYFLGRLTNTRMRDYVGIIDEYDLFVDPKNFNYENFNPTWLKEYSKTLLKKISENDDMRSPIIKILKERIKNTNDKEYLNIFINHFI
ncbi:SIR2 family protein [Priestia megaterium]|uniref:SIR2 family protein n=1 Tax=Priestia megaterium TaxID=1404 RepID=UPI00406BAADC